MRPEESRTDRKAGAKMEIASLQREEGRGKREVGRVERERVLKEEGEGAEGVKPEWRPMVAMRNGGMME